MPGLDSVVCKGSAHLQMEGPGPSSLSAAAQVCMLAQVKVPWCPLGMGRVGVIQKMMQVAEYSHFSVWSQTSASCSMRP